MTTALRSNISRECKLLDATFIICMYMYIVHEIAVSIPGHPSTVDEPWHGPNVS